MWTGNLFTSFTLDLELPDIGHEANISSTGALHFQLLYPGSRITISSTRSIFLYDTSLALLTGFFPEEELHYFGEMMGNFSSRALHFLLSSSGRSIKMSSTRNIRLLDTSLACNTGLSSDTESQYLQYDSYLLTRTLHHQRPFTK